MSTQSKNKDGLPEPDRETATKTVRQFIPRSIHSSSALVSIVCITCGSILPCTFYVVWFTFVLHYSTKIGFIIGGIVLAISVIPLILFYMARCIATVALAELFRMAGRITILILLTSIVLRGPVANIVYNGSTLVGTIQCVSVVAENETDMLLNLINGPSKIVSRQVQKGLKTWREVTPTLTEKMEVVDHNLAYATNGVQKMESTVQDLHTTCTSTMSKSDKICKNGNSYIQEECKQSGQQLEVWIENKAYEMAMDKVKEFFPNGLPGVDTAWCKFAGNCPISTTPLTLLKMSGLNYKLDEVCHKLDLKPLDNLCKSFDEINLCDKLEILDSVNKIISKLSLAQNGLNWTKDLLAFDITEVQPVVKTKLNTKYGVSETNSASLTPRINTNPSTTDEKETWSSVTSRAQKTLGRIGKGVEVLAVVCSFCFVYLIVVTWQYISHWYTSDKFDNRYITNTIDDTDDVDDGFIRLLYDSNVKKSMAKGAIIIGIHFAVALGFFALDRSLAYMMELSYDLVQDTRQSSNSLDSSSTFVVRGGGPLFGFFNSFLNGFNFQGIGNITKELLPCFKAPRDTSNFYSMEYIAYGLYAVVFAVISAEAFTARWRYQIVRWFHPNRHTERTTYLREKILRERKMGAERGKRKLDEEEGELKRKNELYGKVMNKLQSVIKPKAKCISCGYSIPTTMQNLSGSYEAVYCTECAQSISEKQNLIPTRND